MADRIAIYFLIRIKKEGVNDISSELSYMFDDISYECSSFPLSHLNCCLKEEFALSAPPSYITSLIYTSLSPTPHINPIITSSLAKRYCRWSKPIRNGQIHQLKTFQLFFPAVEIQVNIEAE